MRTDTMIHMAVALSASLPLGTIVAFLWSERRWRERERWLRDHRLPALDESSASSCPAESRLIPIRRRPFHEALYEDEPDLAPSPQARAIVRERAAHPRHDDIESPRIVHEPGAGSGSLSMARQEKAWRKPLAADKPSERVNGQAQNNEVPPSSVAPLSAGHKGTHQRAVFALQANLSRLGFTDPRGRPLARDGHYGPHTHAALAAFQREQGLPVTGLADAATINAVEASVR